jgi:hypothetical protein
MRCYSFGLLIYIIQVAEYRFHISVYEVYIIYIYFVLMIFFIHAYSLDLFCIPLRKFHIKVHIWNWNFIYEMKIFIYEMNIFIYEIRISHVKR